MSLIVMIAKKVFVHISLMVLLSGSAYAHENMKHKQRRPSPVAGDGVYINAEQGKTITLTVAKVAEQRIEKWVRTAGSVNPATRRVRGRVYGKEAELIKDGQKIRIFPLVGREPVLQGKVVSVITNTESLIVETDLEDKWYGNVKFYVMEIIVDFGRSLAIPNEAIIEEEGRKVVYVSGKNNRYLPRDILVGQRGELYTQILHGLKAGEEVVTFGSFFIDAQYKLCAKGNCIKKPKSNERMGGKFAHHHH